MAMKDISVYVPECSAGVFHHHISMLSAGRGIQYMTICHDIDVFLTTRGVKLACFQIPYPWDPVIETEIDRLYDHVDQILILGSELHEKTVSFMRRYDREKITYFACGKLNVPLNISYVDRFPDWIITTVAVYKNIAPVKLFELTPWATKPLMFDVLLGRKKPHRDTAYNYVLKHGLKPQCALSYMNSLEPEIKLCDTTTDQWIWETDDLQHNARLSEIFWTVERIPYYGKNVSVSQIMPISIYNQTAYSLVCETGFDNDFVFITEKTVKPMLARRLFLLLGHRYNLAYLRELGFQTFQGIIDESYDEIEAVNDRHLAALEQMSWLCTQDQADILQKARPIIEHNFNHLYTTDWYAQFQRPFSRHFYPGTV